MAPLQDQECAGALMWVWVTFAYVIPAVAITVQMLSPTSAQSQEIMEAARQRTASGILDGAKAQ
jgi:cytochrome c oxidase assembly factor CtaG